MLSMLVLGLGFVVGLFLYLVLANVWFEVWFVLLVHGCISFLCSWFRHRFRFAFDSWVLGFGVRLCYWFGYWFWLALSLVLGVVPSCCFGVASWFGLCYLCLVIAFDSEGFFACLVSRSFSFWHWFLGSWSLCRFVFLVFVLGVCSWFEFRFLVWVLDVVWFSSSSLVWVCVFLCFGGWLLVSVLVLCLVLGVVSYVLCWVWFPMSCSSLFWVWSFGSGFFLIFGFWFWVLDVGLVWVWVLALGFVS